MLFNNHIHAWLFHKANSKEVLEFWAHHWSFIRFGKKVSKLDKPVNQAIIKP